MWMRKKERKRERRETEKKRRERDGTKRKKERKKGREGVKEKEGIWPSPDDCFRFGQPCQPLGLQTERF